MSGSDAAPAGPGGTPRSSGRPIDRRHFLRLSAGASGGLLVVVSFPGCGWNDGGSGAPAVDHRLDAFLEIDTHGHATVRIPVPEIGQGVRTSLAMLVAEELDLPWERVRVRQSGAVEEMGPHPFAGGSWSVRAYWEPFRRTGAAARRALLRAASERWDVAVERLETGRGEVLDPRSGRRLPYGELAAAAAETAADGELDPASVPLKDPSDFHLIGTGVRHLDTPDIVRGATRFGSDVRVEGMLRAVVARCPVYGGTVAAFDDAGCREIPGFRRTAAIDAVGEPDRPYAVAGVAVIADTTWAALRARERLEVRWDEGPNAEESSVELLERSRRLVGRRGETFREGGDVDAALATAARTVRGEYSAPFLVHAPMEPMNCVVSVTEDACEIWAPTQIPIPVRRLAAQLTGLDPERITVHVERSGGGFGRRLSADFVAEAIPIARAAGAPVQVLWTREDETRHSMFRPLNVHRLEAGLDAEGRLTGWLHRQAGTSRYAFRPNEPLGLSEFRAGTYPAALAGSHRLEYTLAESNLPRGPLRAPGLNTFTWAVECFLDEVAAASGRDPLELRLSLLEPVRELPYDEDDPVFSTGRMAGVLRAAAEASDWGRELPEGRGLGIACAFTFGTYAAHVAEVSVGDGSTPIRVHRIWSAIDCGRVVNPNGLRHQVTGGALDGLGAALHGEVTVVGGAVVQSNFHDVPLLTMPEAPEVEVRWIESGREPTGAGEPPYPPMAPAIGNAVYAASGVRLRDLPLLSDANRERLSRSRPSAGA